MNITDRNFGRDNKKIQDVSNSINNWLSLPNKDPKTIRVLEKVPQSRTLSSKKTISYDPEYATKNNMPGRSSYHDDLINSLNINEVKIADDSHMLITSNYFDADKGKNRIIEKVKPKNQISGLIDKNLMTHLIVPNSLASSVVPKNNIKPMNVYRKPDKTPLAPIVTPVTSTKEKMITIR
tara:strand:- start:2660 stop:3199 length:540 start_codon:yes stop_codon:yes gene_type:complete